MSIHYYTHPDCRLHPVPPGHPERPQRTAAIEDHLKSREVDRSLLWVEPDEAPIESLLRVHEERYLEYLETRCRSAGDGQPTSLDGGDTWAGQDSWRIARLGAGAAMAAVDAVLTGETGAAFVGMRPPGHHARPGAAMGFCLLGNVAIAARHAQANHGLNRILVVDWDVHHGNGTQEIFYEDESVFFFSIHQSLHWPFSGKADETGAGAGMGTTLNVPVEAGSRITRYEEAITGQLFPAMEEFQPELVIISAGFDAHVRDPLGGIELESADFGKLTRMVADLSGKYCDGRMVSVLEGGYDLDGLACSVEAHLLALAE